MHGGLAVLCGFPISVVILVGAEWYLTDFGTFTSPVDNDVGHLVTSLFYISISSLETCLFRSFVHLTAFLGSQKTEKIQQPHIPSDPARTMPSFPRINTVGRAVHS